MPVAEWNYKAEDASVKHIGPMAQDFAAAFGLGQDDKHIATVDADGVALAAIQGLNAKVDSRDREIAQLKQNNAQLEQDVAALKVASAPTVPGMALPAPWLWLMVGLGVALCMALSSIATLLLVLQGRRTTG